MSRKKNKESIQWVTVYLTGESDFREEVREAIEHSKLNFMPGFTETQSGDLVHDLYWIDGRTRLRELKEVIGAGTIWKYRIRFYDNLEDFVKSQSTDRDAFSERERSMISEMHRLEKGFSGSSEAA